MLASVVEEEFEGPEASPPKPSCSSGAVAAGAAGSASGASLAACGRHASFPISTSGRVALLPHIANLSDRGACVGGGEAVGEGLWAVWEQWQEQWQHIRATPHLGVP